MFNNVVSFILLFLIVVFVFFMRLYKSFFNNIEKYDLNYDWIIYVCIEIIKLLNYCYEWEEKWILRIRYDNIYVYVSVFVYWEIIVMIKN